MPASDPGLFDLLSREWTPRGKNREAWVRATTAEVTIIDAAAVREAAARVEEQAVPVGFSADPEPDDNAPATLDGEHVKDAFEALDCLISGTGHRCGRSQASPADPGRL
jgi:hypothetical protein